MRKRLWQIHSWLGLITGLGLLVIGLTGSLLVFHEELEMLVNPGLVRVEPTATGRLPLDTLLAEAQRQLPDHEITGWLPQYDAPRLADVLYVIRHGENEWLVATLDPYTGRLLASPRLGTQTLTGWLLDLHYEFFAGNTGLFIAGLFAVALCLLGISGVWIYREFWKNFLTLRWRRGARLLFSDLHKFVGISSAAFNLLLGFTGAYWNLTHVIGHWINGDPPQPRIESRLYAGSLSLDSLARDAATRFPGFRANFISLPSDPAAPSLTFWGTNEPRGPLTSPYGSMVVYDPQTNAHKATIDLRAAGLWRRIVDTFAPLHYGTFGGLPIKILWCLGGLAPGILAVSGFVIWRLRKNVLNARA
ncbi:MAG: PepSY-associated TM helix domain-containing protein [Nibricoccus sp.]